jgi:AraC family transcriptional regulator, transcriptional activator of pobA
MANIAFHRIKTISEYHKFMGHPKPAHPLISVVHLESIKEFPFKVPINLVFDFYCIALKKNLNVKYKYGQENYDFDEGVLYFMSPNQVFGVGEIEEEITQPSGWILLVHPDFLWQTPLAKNIKQYEYFSYSANEALYLSEKEETMITNIVQNMENEYHSNMDKFSQDVIIAQLELLLTYSDRFYNRQFLTRKISNHKILNRLEDVLSDYFNNADLITKGLPTVQYIAETLNISPNYLSGLLKTLTGQSTQQHIHDKLIEKSKEKLSNSDLSVSEIAYAFGFEHPPSFSKFFKNKTNVSPLEFRQSFN